MRFPASCLAPAVMCGLAMACSASTPPPADAGNPDVPAADAGSDAGTPDVPAPVDVTSDATGPVDAPRPVDGGPVGCTLSGSLLGSPLAEMDCLSDVQAIAEGVRTDILIVDYPSVCGLYASGQSQSNSRMLDLRFSGAAVTPRTYQVVTDPVEVVFQNLDGRCNAPSGESASSGTVTIVRADAFGIAGYFDAVLNADHVAGTFNAPRCVQTVTDAGGVACH